MSQRKKRGRSSESTGNSKQSSSHDPEGKPAATPNPPKRNYVMLSVSILLFAIWVSFLGYVAMFG